MKLTRRLAILIASLLFLAFPVTAFLCGTERWEVKVCQDAHVKYLFKDFDTDTEELIATRHRRSRSYKPTHGPLAVRSTRRTGLGISGQPQKSSIRFGK